MDPTAAGAELVARQLHATGRFRVIRFDDPAAAVAHARAMMADPPLAVVVGLRFPGRAAGGLDVLRAFARWCPESTPVVRPVGSGDRLLLEQAWLAYGPLAVVAGCCPGRELESALDHLARIDAPPVDPTWRSLLPDPPP